MMINRYSRQELFANIGKEGQQKIRSAKVGIIGCGALGSLQAEILTRAGIGNLKIIDRDFVEFTNLQRQALFTEQDAMNSIPKAVAAAEHLKEINAEVTVEPVIADFNPDNLYLISGVDLILDGTDNFQTRYWINDLAWKESIPWIYGACVGSGGIACAFLPDSFPCLRCIFESEPPPGVAPTCDTAGIVWPAVGAVVSYQISAALKTIVGTQQRAQMLQLDIWENQYHIISLQKAKRSDCPTCGTRQFPSLVERAEFETSLCGRNAVQIQPRQNAGLDLKAIEERWKQIGTVFSNPFLTRLTLDSYQIVLFPNGRALIQGTNDPTKARDLYAKYIGI